MYCCRKCGRSFFLRNGIFEHNRFVHRVNTAVCNLCLNSFQTNAELVLHQCMPPGAAHPPAVDKQPPVVAEQPPAVEICQALDQMRYVDEVVNDPDYKFEFPTPHDRPWPPIISFSDVSFGYPGSPILFKDLNFGIDLDSRIAMVGPDGIGKSTILKIIVGELQPSCGTVFRSAKVRLAVFSQRHVDGLDLSSNPLLYMMRCFPGVPEQELRAHLGSFGVTGNLALQPMYTLSGGQKSQVAFAKITFKKPHIILLDEPSNHLGLDAVEALIQGLGLFQGGILMVSNDEHLISGSAEEIWVISEGRVTPFHGTFQDYKKILQSK